MRNQNLFEEQLTYIRENKERLFGEYSNAKLGFDLNFTFYFMSILEFELRKKFSTVSKEFGSDSVLIHELGDIMDCVASSSDDVFSLKESFKMEAKISLIADYIRSIRNKRVFPSEIKRKEKTIMNALHRAHKIIDDFFDERDVYFNEISDIIDIYELIVRDNGKVVHLHFGRGGLSLTEDKSSYDLLEYVMTEREALDVKKELVQKRLTTIENLKRIAISEGLSRFEERSGLVELKFSSYAILSKSKEKLIKELTEHEVKLNQVISFLKSIKHILITVPEGSTIDLFDESFRYGAFQFKYSQNDVNMLKEGLDSYFSIERTVNEVQSALQSNELNTNTTFINNVLQFKTTIKRNPTGGMLSRNDKVKTINMTFNCVGGKLYRLTGEEVLTSDVIIFEILEKVRNYNQDYLLTIERAKEMLLSILTEEEEAMLHEQEMTILEGESNYYALLVNHTYNNVIKIPKVLKNKDEIRALCIHPADSRVPMFDGFAAIALSVKSGDEQYVLEHSNEFSVSETIKRKVMKVYNTFVSDDFNSVFA